MMLQIEDTTGGDKVLVPAPKTVRPSQARRVIRQSIPESILNNEELNRTIAECLPPNYSFEVPKTVWRIQQLKASTVALQFPEGLLMYSSTLADILERFAGVKHCIILGDVAYGACCIDDITASMLGAELLVHYGHSCLVPVSSTRIPCLYVFVGIVIDTPHLIATIQHNFPKESTHIVLAGTIQFSAAVQQAAAALKEQHYSIAIPQSKPLSSGEVLGCTAPRLSDGDLGFMSSNSRSKGSPVDRGDLNEARAQSRTAEGAKQPVMVFVADGRFHLEAMMIANPDVPTYRYDPFTRQLMREHYDHRGMRTVRRSAVEEARDAKEWGVVLGTLGRQGNLRTLEYVQQLLRDNGKNHTVFLVSELSPAKVARFKGVIEAWVQIACPRLSIDWGEGFPVPVLTTYELSVALGKAPPWWLSSSNGLQDTQEQTQARGGVPEAVDKSPKEANGSCMVCDSQCESDRECGGRSDSSDCSKLLQGEVMKGSSKVEDEFGVYPMDYYAMDGGPWNSVHKVSAKPRQ